MNKKKFSEEIETIKKNKIEVFKLKNATTDLKNLIENFNSRIKQKKESTNSKKVHLKITIRRKKKKWRIPTVLMDIFKY